MFFLKKVVGFLAVIAVIPAAFAVSRSSAARLSVSSNSMSRMPTMSTQINGGISATLPTSTTYLDSECVEAYTDCIKGGEACGTTFEECTNKTLFFAKKVMCSSVLMQCKSSGIQNLFGTSSTTLLANKDSNEEYVYPTDASILGQLIEAGYINNRYTTSQCVKRYSSCLKKSDVCGSDFELCTTNTEFRTQKIFCDSTIARCEEEGVTELFGTASTTANPATDSRLGVMISEGASLAAVNAVATCYKIADNCILKACAQNPYKCTQGSDQSIVTIVEDINNADGTTTTNTTEFTEAVNAGDIRGYIENSCFDTIGANKYCYATFISDGIMPTNSQLRDEENREDVFSEAYSSRMNDSMQSNITELLEKFDKKIKTRCSDSIMSCAMRSCGGGSGAACYASAFNASNTYQTIANSNTRDDIRLGCSAIVNNDTSCKYAAATFDETTATLSFLDESLSLFDQLFPEAGDDDVTNSDPIGAIAALDAKLSTSYNDAALENMKNQCSRVAQSCVKSLCGADYSNCYRNRTDIYSSITNSGDASYNASMNKVGGVLDNTIIIGLCLNTVKNNEICSEHIKAEAAKRETGDTLDSWGAASSSRDAWLTSGTESATATTSSVQDSDADGDLLCTTAADGNGAEGSCDDASGSYIYPKMVSTSSYTMSQTTYSVFKDLIYDLEKEAQAKYNAKLTKQQNSCLSGNTGSVLGSKDNGGTFAWVKLKGSKVPSSYAVSGLTTKQFVASNDIYNSFCRIRVTLQSDDKYIQDAISEGEDWGTSYFAAGDSFTCGAWIPNDALETVSNVVGGKARAKATKDDSRNRNWLTLAGIVGGGVAGGVGMNKLQNTGIGGLLGTTNKTDTAKTNVARCEKYASAYIAAKDGSASATAEAAISAMTEINPTDPAIDLAQEAVDAAAAKPKDKNLKKSANSMMESLKTACSLGANDAKKSSSKTLGNLAGVGVGGIAGGILAYQATKSVQDSKADKVEQAAIDAWMEEVGSKIHCYIGSDEVGDYGDAISTEMD